LFRKASRKKLTVQKALENNRWVSHIFPIVTAQEIREYVTVWEAIGQTQLHENTEDISFVGAGQRTENRQLKVHMPFNSKGHLAS